MSDKNIYKQYACLLTRFKIDNKLKYLIIDGDTHIINKDIAKLFYEASKNILDLNDDIIKDFNDKINLKRKLDYIQYLDKSEDKKIDKNGYIYLIKCEKYYKIGRTNNVKKRIKTFSVEMPFDIKLINSWKVSDMFGCEKQVHEKFEDFRINGEWFDLTDECLIEICNIIDKWE